SSVASAGQPLPGAFASAHHEAASFLSRRAYSATDPSEAVAPERGLAARHPSNGRRHSPNARRVKEVWDTVAEARLCVTRPDVFARPVPQWRNLRGRMTPSSLCQHCWLRLPAAYHYVAKRQLPPLRPPPDRHLDARAPA